MSKIYTRMPSAARQSRTLLSLVVAAMVALALIPAFSYSQTTNPLRFGIIMPGGALASKRIEAETALVGEAPSILLSYDDFGQGPPLDQLRIAHAMHASPIITWEPWLWGGGVDQHAYTLRRIASGSYDSYIRQWAFALRSWGRYVMLRFAQEMNGNWYPWSEQTNNNSPGDYVIAWRHVHDLFAKSGVHNVGWVWSPNASSVGNASLMGLYPGPKYVDKVALDGYNWGSTASSGWQSPAQIFGRALVDLRTTAPGKPIIIAETASTEAGGSKPQWISALMSYLSAQRDVTAFVWFNEDKETDWRINSTTSSARVFASALEARHR